MNNDLFNTQEVINFNDYVNEFFITNYFHLSKK